MKVLLLLSGKTSFPFVREGMEMYEKRISRYLRYERVEVQVSGGQLPKEIVMEKEADALLKRISPQDEVVLLDEKGDAFTSVEWARWLQKRLFSGADRNLVFVTGGAFGFSERMYRRASALLSFSEMTFSHQIIRLFFTEQLYRAMTIIKGIPYHNE
ncbi:MAG TPA: 23S rRNA (pseudouridine(1915)-N(3))-methyltransferase RlmH [Candidatus Coprenecus stercoripullorum]|nr:23S rRNA (pseudouridine(1915)-N(3))-methyltransferase RlmH [Candidatus Coprenecus stercoripullorum]